MTARWTRTILGSGLLLAVACLFAADAFFESRIAGSSVAVLLGLAGYLEFARMAGSLGGKAREPRVLAWIGFLGTAYFLALAWWQGSEGPLGAEWIAGGIAGLLLAGFGALLARGSYREGFPHLAPAVLGALLFGLLYSYLLRIYHLEHGLLIGIVFFLGVKGTDIVAYLAGSTFGRHRFLKVSPGKTLEGYAAAFAFGGLWFAGVSWKWDDVFFAWPRGAVYGLLLAAMSALGDLTESVLKRFYGVKDSGSLLPEFGGVLDMIDSFLFSGFVFWCLIAD